MTTWGKFDKTVILDTCPKKERSGGLDHSVVGEPQQRDLKAMSGPKHSELSIIGQLEKRFDSAQPRS